MWIITGVLLGAIFLATEVGFRAGPHAHVVMRSRRIGYLLVPMSRVCCRDFGFIQRLEADTLRATRAELHSLGSGATHV